MTSVLLLMFQHCGRQESCEILNGVFSALRHSHYNMECSQSDGRQMWRLLLAYWITSHRQTRAGSSVWILLWWWRTCHVISGFCCDVNEIFTHLGCYAVWIGILLPSSFLDCWTLEDGTCRLFQIDSKYQTMLHSISEEWRSQKLSPFGT